MKGRRPALIEGIVHGVKWTENTSRRGRTRCGKSFTTGTPERDWIMVARIVLAPIDCMACIAVEAD